MKSAVTPKSATCNQSMRKILEVTHGAVSNGFTVRLLLSILKRQSAWLKGSLLQDAPESTCLTCAGVHLQAQQQPSKVLCAGKPKTSAANFQSCLTSTRAPLRNGLAILLHLSDCSQADPSCLHVGHSPVARIVRDHLIMEKTSSQVSEHTLL